MKQIENAYEAAKCLMSLDPSVDRTDQEEKELDDLAKETGERFGWDAFCDACSDYLYHECVSEQQVAHFAVNAWCYIWYFKKQSHIKDPVKFLSYLYYRVDVEKDISSSDLFDTLTQYALPDIESFDRENFLSQNDPRIKKGIKKWESGEYE